MGSTIDSLLILPVTPVPSLHPAVTMPLLGGVKTSVANVFYLENTCTTPFHDDPAGGQTCLEVESAGSAYAGCIRTCCD